MFTNTRFIARTAIAAGVALGITGVIQITDTPSGETTVVGIEHALLGALSAALLLSVPAVLHLARLAGRGRLATAIPVAGLIGLAVLTVTSNVRGEDLSIFPAVAVASNAAIFGAFIAIAIGLRRSGRVPRALAIALPLTWIATFPLSQFGGPVLAGAYWLAVGYLLDSDALDSAAPPFARASTA
jgi:hypothetical protein